MRVRLAMYESGQDLALFNLAIDSKLRGCDWVQLRGHDVTHGGQASGRATVMQQKIKQPVDDALEMAEQTDA